MEKLPVVWIDMPFNVVRISRHDSEKLYSESLVLHRIKLVLISQGYDVIKKRMWKDGHLMGDDQTQYIRDRQHKFAIYDPDWQIRNLYEDYNNNEEITLSVVKQETESVARATLSTKEKETQ